MLSYTQARGYRPATMAPAPYIVALSRTWDAAAKWRNAFQRLHFLHFASCGGGASA